MIYTEDSIRYSNVISKKYEFYYEEAPNVLADFKKELDSLKLHCKGPLFYALWNVPINRHVIIEYFMPVKEDYAKVPEDMSFHTYYSVEHMMSILLSDNIESKTEFAYASLIEFMSQSNLTQVTPFYHIVLGQDHKKFLQLKVGYRGDMKIRQMDIISSDDAR